MRPYILISALLLSSCASDRDPRPPPRTRLVYPAGATFWRPEAGSSTNGFLYVAGANFDNCFDSGSVMALDLDQVGTEGQRLRAFGTPFVPGVDDSPVDITELNIAAGSYVQINNFAGEMALWQDPGRGGAPRLFVPTRSEGNNLQIVDVAEDGVSLTCLQSASTRDCRANALSLSDNIPGAVNGLPGAPGPLGVTVKRDDPEAHVWVTHTELVGPEASLSESDFRGYVVDVPAGDPNRDTLHFNPLGTDSQLSSGSHATAIGGRYTYVTGRNFVAGQLGALPANFVLRLVDRQVSGRFLESGLTSVFDVLEGRGVQVVSLPLADPAHPELLAERVYLVARGPDTLLTLDVANALSDSPQARVVSSAPLPGGASELELITRASGRGNILAVTGSSDGAVSIYDEEVGQLVAQIQVGDDLSQPFGLTVDQRGNSARLFATTFGDGRVAVIDIPDLDRPQDARLVARLGTPQERDPRQGTSVCKENEP